MDLVWDQRGTASTDGLISARRYPSLKISSVLVNGVATTETPILWAFSALSLSVAYESGSKIPRVGDTLTVTVTTPTQATALTVRVIKTERMYGSFLVVIGSIPSLPEGKRVKQRRANHRIALDRRYPVVCSIKDQLGESDPVVCQVVDVSLGGLGLTMSQRNKTILPGLRLQCHVQTPFNGGYDTVIVVRAITEESSSSAQSLRVCCESDGATPERWAPLARHMMRFATEPLDSIISEKLIPHDVASTIDYVVIAKDQCGDLRIGASFVPDDSDVTMIHVGNYPQACVVVGRLAGTVVSMSDVSIEADKSHKTIRAIRIVTHERLDRKQIVRSALVFLAELAARVGIPSVEVQPFADDRTGSNPKLDASGRAVVLKSTPCDPLQNRQSTGLTWTRRRINRLRAASLLRTFEESGATGSTVAWDRYAQAYDVMCSVNPAYQSNLRHFTNWIEAVQLPKNAKICDVGAGTGNYARELGLRYPHADVCHLDWDPVMNRLASRKYRESGIRNIGFEIGDVQNTSFEVSSLDLIVCVNSLYSFVEYSSALLRMRAWLKRGGYLYVIDLGRPINVSDWSQYMIRSSLKDLGLLGTIGAFFRGREAITQNRRIRRSQDLGKFWVHSTQDFERALQHAGLSVEEIGTCYRGDCDYAICTKG